MPGTITRILASAQKRCDQFASSIERSIDRSVVYFRNRTVTAAGSEMEASGKSSFLVVKEPKPEIHQQKTKAEGTSAPVGIASQSNPAILEFVKKAASGEEAVAVDHHVTSNVSLDSYQWPKSRSTTPEASVSISDLFSATGGRLVLDHSNPTRLSVKNSDLPAHEIAANRLKQGEEQHGTPAQREENRSLKKEFMLVCTSMGGELGTKQIAKTLGWADDWYNDSNPMTGDHVQAFQDAMDGSALFSNYEKVGRYIGYDGIVGSPNYDKCQLQRLLATALLDNGINPKEHQYYTPEFVDLLQRRLELTPEYQKPMSAKDMGTLLERTIDQMVRERNSDPFRVAALRDELPRDVRGLIAATMAQLPLRW